jgi:TolB-like protein/DNA-binding winged helix-turn-helix (wHTH) protein/Tfp pilus assembly protein PilF
MAERLVLAQFCVSAHLTELPRVILRWPRFEICSLRTFGSGRIRQSPFRVSFLMPSSGPQPVIRFGAFELDAASGELRKAGISIKLQPQPFRVLLLLAERSGQVVPRDEIRHALWDGEIYVDFDRSINFCINQIRAALNDNPDKPRYIETIPRRGYRFIASVANGSASPPETKPQGWLARFKNPAVVAPILIAVLAAAGVLYFEVSQRHALDRASAGQIHSLAVLPLENLSGDPSQDFFADAMTDELITTLGQISALRVISRTSVMQYKGVHEPLPQIARELDVDAVLEAAVVRSGDQVRITPQLIRASNEKTLWAHEYVGDLRDVLGLQNQVARAIAEQVRVQLTPEQNALLASSHMIDTQAQEFYWTAHFLAHNGTTDGLQKSISVFQQAIDRQPDYALAYAGLSHAYTALGHTVVLRPENSFPQAKAAALKALRLDNGLEEAHTNLGNAKFLYDWDFPGAEKEFQRAVALNPSSVKAQLDYADFLNAMGRSDEAVTRTRRVLQLDPDSPDALQRVTWILYKSRHYDEALQSARRLVDISQDRLGHVLVGMVLEQKHELPEAIRELEKGVRLTAEEPNAFTAHAKAISGDKAGARKVLADMERLSQRTYVSPWWPAIIYSDLGDKDKAFYWLEKCYQGHEHDLVFSKVWPMFDPLRSDPRYKDLMRRVGLPE